MRLEKLGEILFPLKSVTTLLLTLVGQGFHPLRTVRIYTQIQPSAGRQGGEQINNIDQQFPILMSILAWVLPFSNIALLYHQLKPFYKIHETGDPWINAAGWFVFLAALMGNPMGAVVQKGLCCCGEELVRQHKKRGWLLRDPKGCGISLWILSHWGSKALSPSWLIGWQTPPCCGE